ncbi:MAG: methionyl-tRNA formyltransferase [Phycisphaerae bacterium]
MDIIYFGTADFAVPSLRAIVDAGHRVRCVVSQPDRPAGRGKRVQATAMHAAADELGLPHVQADDINAPHHLAMMDGAALGVVAAFGQKIGPAVLKAFPHGCINLHGSLLPKYRGAAPYQWAIIRGERETGVTTFQLNEKWDAGAVWEKASLTIGDTETATELHDRLAALAGDLILSTLQLIEGGDVEPKVQDASLATRAPKLKKADGYLDWSLPARELKNWVNGLWSWPGASADFVSSASGKVDRVQIARADVIEDGLRAGNTEIGARAGGGVAPGTFLDDGTLQTGAGRLRILEMKPAGKNLMPFAAFANGRRLQAGDRLVQVRE